VKQAVNVIVKMIKRVVAVEVVKLAVKRKPDVHVKQWDVKVKVF
jgi:hypothetical protein